nr:unnamed protein product [Callosobruchus chinensis]
MYPFHLRTHRPDGARIGLRPIPAGAARAIRSRPRRLLLQRLPGGRADEPPRCPSPRHSGARPVRADRPAGGSGRRGTAERGLRRGGRSTGLLQAGSQDAERRGRCGQYSAAER